MKFGAQLEAYAVPEWAEQYISYSKLKTFLKKRKREIGAAPKRSWRKVAVLSPRSRSSAGECNAEDEEENLNVRQKHAQQHFWEMLQAELLKVERHYLNEKNHLLQRLSGIDDELHALSTTFYDQSREHKSIDAHRKRLQRCIVFLWDIFDKLDGFVKLNTMAAYKILKKRDKMIGSPEGGGILEDLTFCKKRLSALAIDAKTKKYVMHLFKRSGGEGVTYEGKSEFEDIQQTLNTQTLIARQPFRSHSTHLAFFTGGCLVLLLDIMLLCFIPARNQHYTLDSVLAVFPIFRFFLMLVLLLWAMGVAIYFFEEYGVNYRFLFDIDAKCNITSETIFAVAALQSFLWIGCFGIFLADYKFLIFGPHSAHWIYPWILMLIQTGVWCYPHRAIRYRYRRALLGTIRITFFSGVFLPKDVTLVSNVVGDILTSFSKPLADLGYILCYFSTGLVHAVPATCPRVQPWLTPMLVGLPFWIRLVQCYVRYRHEPPKDSGGKGYIHFANMGKYFASLTVVIVTALPWWESDDVASRYETRFIWIATYITATIYAFVWDIHMDWGLFPDPDAFIRPYQQTMYPKWLYYTIALINLVGRLTWAMTLMPMDVVNNRKIDAALLTLFISTAEIVRRSAVSVVHAIRRYRNFFIFAICQWLILRLENEHLTNSSRYRAMLWVPRMVDEQSSKLELIMPTMAGSPFVPSAQRARISSLNANAGNSEEINRGGDELTAKASAVVWGRDRVEASRSPETCGAPEASRSTETSFVGPIQRVGRRRRTAQG